MSNDKNSIKRALLTTIMVSVVASVVVSFSAVSLKSLQDSNKLFDKRKNILEVTGLVEPGQSLSKKEADTLYQNIQSYLVDLETGDKVEGDPSVYDQKKASKDTSASKAIPGSQDIAGIKRKENLGLVYEVIKAGEVETVVLPIRGYGLWSTLWGFLALSGDGKTVKGITYYEHGETPGLGGEVDNPMWKKSWIGKKVYDEQGKVVVHVVKGKAARGSDTEVDGLSGATLTSVGVNNMIEYWLSDSAYGKVLKKYYWNR